MFFISDTQGGIGSDNEYFFLENLSKTEVGRSLWGATLGNHKMMNV